MAVRVSGNFPGGGVANVRFIADNDIEFDAPVDESPWSLWFYFCVSGLKGQRVTLTQVNMTPVLGRRESRGYGPVCPVYTAGGQWRRVDEAGIRYDEDAGRFAFSLLAEDNDVYVAFCFPYLLEDFERFMAAQPAALWQRRVLGRTAEGRAYPLYLIGRPDDPAVRQLVVLSARTHAGESSGSFVLEGALAALLEDSALSREALAQTVFAVVPIVDLDSVQEGRYGKDRYPQDFNRDWRVTPCHPEIALVQQALEALAERYRPVFALDLHAPQPGGPSYFPPNRETETGSDIWHREWNFVQAYEDACRGRFSFHLDDVDRQVLNWGGLESPALMRQDLFAHFGIPALTMEYSYHRTAEGALLYPDDWRLAGRILVETLAKTCLTRDALGQDTDASRVPSWTIPPEWRDWRIVRMPDGLVITDADDALRIAPERADNGALLVTRRGFAADRAQDVLEIETEKPVTVEICCAHYDAKGRFIRNGKREFLRLPQGKTVWHYAPGAIAAAACHVNVRLEALVEPICLKVLPPR